MPSTHYTTYVIFNKIIMRLRLRQLLVRETEATCYNFFSRFFCCSTIVFIEMILMHSIVYIIVLQ